MTDTYETKRDAAAIVCAAELDEGRLTYSRLKYSKAFKSGADWARLLEAQRFVNEYVALEAKLDIAKAALDFYAKHHHHLKTTSPNFAREALAQLSPPTDPDDGWEQNMGG